MYVIGIDLGGTKLATAIFNTKGETIYKENSPLEKRTGVNVSELIKTQINKFVYKASRERMEINSIGICVPGIYWSKTGRVWAPNIPGWADYPLLDDLNSILKDSKIKIQIDSDRSCYILGETWQGAAKGCNDAIFLSVGTGIGAGILIDGRILRGSNDIAGAIGWMALNQPFFSKYIECGCFEYHSSGEGMVRIAKEILSENKNYSGILKRKNIDDIATHDIFEAYKLNDHIAIEIINLCIQFWGMAVANLVSLFNPEKIIFGGGVFGPALQFLDLIMAEAKKWSQPISINQVTLVGSSLGGDAGLIGAGYLALRNLNNNY